MTVAQIDVLISFFAKSSSPVYPWALTTASIGYGYLQRRERRRKTASLQSRIVQLEKQIDPTRTSSLFMGSAKSVGLALEKSVANLALREPAISSSG
jgi:hypothetical protein